MAINPKQETLNPVDPWQMPLADIDVSDSGLFERNEFWPYFERLRAEDPVHYCADSDYGPFWSVTRYDDIKAVDSNHGAYSSAGGITVADRMEDFKTDNFISMDRPKHDVQRKSVAPVVAPRNLAELEPIIRQRATTILDSLPIGETFNWVDRVSIELTTQMLATLFDFPFEERRKLTYWSDMATSSELAGGTTPEPERRAALMECLEAFNALWQERAAWDGPGSDLISMMAHNEATRDLPSRPLEYLGNLILLIVGGNDTTRNSITGGVLALNQFPGEYDKLRADQSLIPNMVAEIIRWQTPLTYMRRTALHDTELRGKQIRKGDKVLMWYVSGNRDEEHFAQADDLIIDRPNARSHVSFGFGIHRCMGNRLAEMQLRIVWEEIMKRFEHVEVVGEPVRVRSSFVKGYSDLPVVLHAKS